jgi:F-type H+-transporting ATPase subunit a
MFSPMEQYVIYPVLSLQLTFTNVAFYLLLSSVLTIVLGTFLDNGPVVTNVWGIVRESMYRTILNMVESLAGKGAVIYLPLFYSLFFLILFCNLLGLIPYSSTATVEIVLTLSLSFTLLIGFAVLGFLTHRLYLFAIFLPAGTPVGLIPLLVALEVVAYLSKVLSLGLRLAINLITGHCLAKVLSGFLWVGILNGANSLLMALCVAIFSGFLAFELLISYLQAYIFLFIALLTLKDVSMESHN